jgi:hypothetical protein
VSVFGHCRVSTARQANEGESLEVQRRQLKGYADMHGMTLDEIVVEEGVSGSMPVSERPKGGPLFAREHRDPPPGRFFQKEESFKFGSGDGPRWSISRRSG